MSSETRLLVLLMLVVMASCAPHRKIQRIRDRQVQMGLSVSDEKPIDPEEDRGVEIDSIRGTLSDGPLIMNAIRDSETGEMVYARQLTLEVAYNMINNVKYYLEQNKISISDPRYTENVQYDICVKEEDKERITEGLIQKCEGKITITEGDAGYYLM